MGGAARAGVVGLVGRDLNAPVLAELAGGLQHGIGEDRSVVLLASSHGGGERLGEVLESFWSLPVEGVVVLGAVDRPDDVSRFARRGLPVVVVGDFVRTPNVACVGLDLEIVARVSVDHLVGSGLRRIGMIGPPIRSPGNSPDERGFLAAVEAAGVEGAIVRAEATIEGGGAALRDLIERFSGVDGVVAHDDLMAIGAIRGAAELGILVPTQIAVVSADDMGLGALVIPTLTSVRPIHEQLVEAVVTALGRLIEEPGLSPEPVAVPVELVARESA
ncbi:MAG: LacI family DNA-binding transcriptional regulator [Acidimicrobiaceae bacterium]|nr:LacI family DNA-binding transcriptional regulator [Acidimicrobiaceae bacterium]